MASTLGRVTPERKEKKNCQGRSNKSYLKSDAEFKKIFGLTKDLRVCLTRVPDYLGSGNGFESFSSLVKSDTYEETKFTVMKGERKQGFVKKRKTKTVKKVDHTEKRKTESAFNRAVNGGSNATSSQLISSILPDSDVSCYNILTSHSKMREKRTEAEHCTCENQEKGTLSSNTAFEQRYCLNKNYTEDFFPMTPPELEETIRDEKIRRLKQVLREKEAALEEMRKMHQK